MVAVWVFSVVMLLWAAITFAVIVDRVLQRTVSVPVDFRAIFLGGDAMADVLTYRVAAGPVVDHDVVTRELSVVVDGGEPVVSEFSGSATDLDLLTVPQGAEVVLSLVDIDDAGNRSDAAVVSFVAADTIPPAAPGAFGVTLVAEAPAPEADPEA